MSTREMMLLVVASTTWKKRSPLVVSVTGRSAGV